MRLFHQNTLGLVAALLVAAPLAAGCRGSKSDAPPVHLQQNMDFQQKYTAQEENEWFHDHRAMRQPVEGTVARPSARLLAADDQYLAADDHLYRGRGPDGRLVDSLPPQIELTAELLERGENRFNIFCAPCHSKLGDGKGMIMQRGWPNPPNSYHSDRLRAMPLGYFFDVPTNGRGTMQSYAAQVPTEDRWAIAAWIRTLQVSQAAQLGDVPEGVAREKGWKQ